MAATLPAPSPSLGLRLRYGALALPLAFVALPLYLQWPAHAAQAWGLPLATLGGLLLLVRLGDAVVDPWLGRRADALWAHSWQAAWGLAAAGCLAIACGFAGLLLVPQGVRGHMPALWAWLGAALLLTSLGTSAAQVVHQSWPARSAGGSAAEQAQWVGAREALALLGVLAASAMPALAGWPATAGVLAALLVLGCGLLLGVVASPGTGGAAGPRLAGPAGPGARPWAAPALGRLLALVLLNGLAAAWPATLVVWYLTDVIEATASQQAGLLALYFAAAAVGVPLWARGVARWGLWRCWLAGMLMSVLGFAGAGSLGAGAWLPFAFIAAACGLALGADLVAPPALLASLLRQGNAPGHAEGAWFGWLAAVNKLALAMAAGLALPLVDLLGYRPGQRDAQALHALAVAYAWLPCALKLAAAALLWRWRGRLAAP